MKKTYITRRHIGEFGVSELDLTFKESFGFKFEDNEEFIVINEVRGEADGEAIEIGSLIAILKEAKAKGATHVEMEENCDREGYFISAFEIKKSSLEEIIKYEENLIISKEEMKQKQIERLERQIERIKNS